MLNTVILMGRLTADPELKTAQSGTSYCRFSIAVDRPYKSGEEKTTDFFNCVAWRSTADLIDKYFAKGQMIAVQGSLRTGSFTNKTGDIVKTVDINVYTVSFTGSKSETGGAEAKPAEPAKPTRRKAAAKGTIDIPPDIDEDLPF